MDWRVAIVGIACLSAVAIVSFGNDAEQAREMHPAAQMEDPIRFGADPMSPQLQEILRQHPRGPVPINQLNWLRPEDYPSAAVVSGLTGATKIDLEIDPFGEVTNCVTTQSSGVRSLDRRACNAMATRARFYPALNKQQQPVAGGYQTTVNWNPADMMPVSSTYSVRARADEQGRLHDCEWLQADPPPLGADDICRKLSTMMSDHPPSPGMGFIAVGDDLIEATLAELAAK